MRYSRISATLGEKVIVPAIYGGTGQVGEVIAVNPSHAEAKKITAIPPFDPMQGFAGVVVKWTSEISFVRDCDYRPMEGFTPRLVAAECTE